MVIGGRRYPSLTVVACAAITAIVWVLSVTGASAAQARPRCPAISAATLAPSPAPTGWAENVTFDDVGNLWVSRLLEGTVERRDRTGRITARVAVDAPGSLRIGPDGQLYIASGDSPYGDVPGRVVRLDPSVSQPHPRIFAAGLAMPNGLAFDRFGHLYVADGRLGVVRLRRDGAIDADWTRRAPKNFPPNSTINGTSTNGIVTIGDHLYVTLTVSLTGRVLRVPIADPTAVTVGADLTGTLPGLLDDLAVLDPNTLAVTMVTGKVGIVDLPTGDVCIAGVGRPVTSVAVRPGRSDRLVAGTETGDLLAITVRR